MLFYQGYILYTEGLLSLTILHKVLGLTKLI